MWGFRGVFIGGERGRCVRSIVPCTVLIISQRYRFDIQYNSENIPALIDTPSPYQSPRKRNPQSLKPRGRPTASTATGAGTTPTRAPRRGRLPRLVDHRARIRDTEYRAERGRVERAVQGCCAYRQRAGGAAGHHLG